jgi:catechol 2,3-dioxygenase-like lactoylglutathione lyase family enzyme
MIGIITSQFDEMRAFYRDVLGFKEKVHINDFVEFENEGVRFALSTSRTMHEATGDESYNQQKSGHSFELAFDTGSPEMVDTEFDALIMKGATSVKKPADMPWNQRTAFFADPDGNIHEIFADLN